MEKYKKEGLEYLFKLKKLCEWLEHVKNQASYDEFVKAGIITRGELRDKKFVKLRSDIVFWGSKGWERGRDWKVVLKNRIQEFNDIEI